MVSDYTYTSTLAIPREVLWRAITSDNRAFMNHLVNDGALNRMDATKIEEVAGRKRRKQTYVPKTIEIPAMVKSVFDDTYLEIFDTQTWDEGVPYELKFEISTGVLGDYYTMHGHTTLEVNPEDSNSCIQTIKGQCTVDIPFVGWYVEQAILMNMGTFYDNYPGHIANFVKELVDNYDGKNQSDSLLEALKRLETHTDSLPPPPNSKPGNDTNSQKGQQDKAALAAALGQVPGNVSGKNGAGIISSSTVAPSEGDTSKPNSANNVNANNNNSESIGAATTGEIVNGSHTK